MRLLVVSDKEDKVLQTRLGRKSMGSFDAVISCGDLRPGYLDYVASVANAPLYFVRGNHDTDKHGYANMGGSPLDGHVMRVGGLRMAGLDGSLAYRDGIVGFSERQMWWRVLLLALRCRMAGGLDVLVTHTPPRGYGDLDDWPHRGFDSFNWLLSVTHPRVMLHGHVHLDYGRIPREIVHPSGTRIVNACGSWVEELD